MKFQPRVSIIIPVYNGSNFLAEAIQSAINQTYKNIEIIVVNDGSNDDNKTENIALSYSNKIKYIKKENGGVASALNVGIKNMSGEYFSWLSHDDLYYKDKIEKQINFIETNNLQNKKNILFSDYTVIDENGIEFGKCSKDHQEIEKKPEYILLRGYLNGITMLIPKSAFDDYGEFDETLKCTQDYDMWKKMMKTYKFIHQQELLAKTRIHKGRDTVINPKVITEGNKLWLNLIEDVSNKRKIELEGSEYAYYEKMSDFLEETPYNEAKKHCQYRMYEIDKNIEAQLIKTKVSIIIPFFNRQHLVIKSIKSAQQQTHNNIEIILINDGSNEKINELEKYIKGDNRIRYIKLDKNYGSGYARNVGIKNATGEYIAFLDSDDEFLNTKIEKQLRIMLRNKGVFSHTSYIRKDENNREKILNIGNVKGIVYPQIIGGCAIATPTVMIKTEYLRKNGFYYQGNLSLGEDICFYIKILENINVLGINEPLSIVNVNPKSSAYDYKKQLEGLKNIIEFILNDKKAREYTFEIYRIMKEYINVYNCFTNQRNELELLLSEIEKYKVEIQKYVDEQKKLNNEIIKIDSEYNSVKKEFEELSMYTFKMENSMSWKLTKPLRKVARIVRAILRKMKIMK